MVLGVGSEEAGRLTTAGSVHHLRFRTMNVQKYRSPSDTEINLVRAIIVSPCCERRNFARPGDIRQKGIAARSVGEPGL